MSEKWPQRFSLSRGMTTWNAERMTNTANSGTASSWTVVAYLLTPRRTRLGRFVDAIRRFVR